MNVRVGRGVFAVLAAVSFLGAGALGCAATTGSDDADSTTPAADSAAINGVRQRSICFSGRTLGANPYDTGGTPEIAEICKRLPGLVRDDWNQRDSAYPFFQWDSSLSHVMDVLVAELDTNHDGRVTSADERVDLNVVGYSWGGFNARDLIVRIAWDSRFAIDRRTVARFVAVDPYRTDLVVVPKGWLTVPSTVQEFYEVRHSVAPPDDCSRVIPGLLGPFTGRDPRCTGSTKCRDFDYSAAAATRGVDHCEVPAVARAAVLAIVAGRAPTGLPPERPVPRY
jgi:hypothetical protein